MWTSVEKVLCLHKSALPVWSGDAVSVAGGVTDMTRVLRVEKRMREEE